MERKRPRVARGEMYTPEESIDVGGIRGRADAVPLAFVPERGVAKEHAQWWNPRMGDKWNAADTSALEGVDAAISA